MVSASQKDFVGIQSHNIGLVAVQHLHALIMMASLYTNKLKIKKNIYILKLFICDFNEIEYKINYKRDFWLASYL